MDFPNLGLLNLFSERLLVTGGLDLLNEALTQAAVYLDEKLQTKPLGTLTKLSECDLTFKLNFFIDQFSIIQHCFFLKNNYLRTLLFEIKHYRNKWAHQQTISVREVYRLYDTIQTVLEELNSNKTDNLYIRINYIREEIAKEMVNKRAQPQVLFNSDNTSDGSFVQQYFTNKKDEKSDNKTFESDETSTTIFEGYENLVCEDEELREKVFLYNKQFVNKN